MKPGDIAYADLPIGAPKPEWWKVKITSRPRHGVVSYVWMNGPLKGKEGRREVKTLRGEK